MENHLKAYYQSRLNALHNFIYSELPLKMMDGMENSSIDLQQKLYNLIETGYIKQQEQQLQKLVEENHQLLLELENYREQESKENQKTDPNMLLIDQLNLEKQKLQIENKTLSRQLNQLNKEFKESLLSNSKTVELEECNRQIQIKDQLIEELEIRSQEFNIVQDNFYRVQIQLKELTQEYMKLQDEYDQINQQNDELRQQIKSLSVIIKENEKDNNEVCERLNTIADETSNQIQSLEKQRNQVLNENRELKIKTKNQLIELYQNDIQQLKSDNIKIKMELDQSKQFFQQTIEQVYVDLQRYVIQIFQKLRQEKANEILQIKKISIEQENESQLKIKELQMEINMFKKREDDQQKEIHENIQKMNEAISEKQEKEDQLFEIQEKLDIIQKNIIDTEQFYQTQIQSMTKKYEDQRMKSSQQQAQYKVQISTLLKQVEQLKQTQSEFQYQTESQIQAIIDQIIFDKDKEIKILQRHVKCQKTKYKKLKRKLKKIFKLQAKNINIKLNPYKINQLFLKYQNNLIQKEAQRNKESS
ncbi:hypothetical protein pb186bvf_018808 [Paramecium bursaria]